MASSISPVFVKAWIVPPSHASPRFSPINSLHEPEVLDTTPQSQHIPFTPKEQLDLRILLIDNHDSYTYNLYQYLSTMSLHPVTVVMNDDFDSWDAFMHNVSSVDDSVDNGFTTMDHFDCIIISPGPGRPSRASDMGIVLEAIKKNSNVPILGVCLGHQALGYVYGCDVKLAPCGPVHGLMSSVFYAQDGDACRLFDGIKQNFDVVRYHSLVVEFPESDELDVEPIAWCNDEVSSILDANHDRVDHDEAALQSETKPSICMGLRHKKYPHYGVQFHPESIGTAENGYNLIWNFCEFASGYKQQRMLELGLESSIQLMQITDEISQHVDDLVHATISSDSAAYYDNAGMSQNKSNYQVIIHKIGKDISSPLPTPEQVFEELYGTRHNSFWLDSSTGETRIKSTGVKRKAPDVQLDREGCPITTNSRFSIMGSDDGPLSKKIEYFGREHSPEQRGLHVTSNSADGDVTEVFDTNILSYLREQLVREHETNLYSYDLDSMLSLSDAAVPFDYRGGFVGYLGYEVRYDCLDDGCRGEHCTIFESENTNSHIPTAAFLFADRSLLYDHMLDDWYVIGVADDASIGSTTSWIQDVIKTMTSLAQHPPVSNAPVADEDGSKTSIEFTPNRSKEQYLVDLARSHDEIKKGESYELCVTNQLTAELKLPRLSAKKVHQSPLELYKRLRRRNPAPFSSYFSLHPKQLSEDNLSGQVSICCSSPERFLSMRKANDHEDTNDFIIESKPIKGTAARYIGPASSNRDQQDFVEKVDSEIANRLKESVKDRAENLMIVDLLRNDFGRVCKVGSVHVPKLMHIESYATVHQMVSTVRGRVDGTTTNAIDVIEACFPGGSMTGAPKHRTVEILDEIEQGVSRGPYSGCLGYISLNGCMDMNIIIRTAVLTPSEASDQSSEAWKVSIGCGGAITALSDSNDEYEEMLLKSRAVREAISEWAHSREQ